MQSMKQLSDRRQATHELIAYYQCQVKLAQLGLSTRRPLQFLERQILFLTMEGIR